MNKETLLQHIQENLDAFIEHKESMNQEWKQFLALHPADIAQFIEIFSKESGQQLFKELPDATRLRTFEYMSDYDKVTMLSILDDQSRSNILLHTPIDELTDLFDILPDEDLKTYLLLLSKQDRQKVLSLLQFDPDSAGGIMSTDIVTLMQDFTVERSLTVLQKILPRRELHHKIFVTNQDNHLIGHIYLEDLVLHKPDQRLSSFLRNNEVVILASEDREQVAHQMRHYHLTIVPVVDDHDNFLGVIPSEILMDIIEQEASENVYHMSAMPAMRQSYFEIPFFKMLFERSYILIILLLAQSLSSLIIRRYEATLCGFLMYFVTMLVSTGGNSSSQTSAVVIQGMASGDISAANASKFLRREFAMACMMALILGTVAFGRTYFTAGSFLAANIAVSVSLALIVLASVVLGSCMPLVLRALKIDPAFAAGPFLATLMDILGLLVFCLVSNFIL